MTHQISRRTLAKGAAWATPVVAASAVVPAYAASSPEDACPVTISDVETAFELRRTMMNEYLGCSGTSDFTIYYGGAGGINGALQSSSMGIINDTACDIDLTQYPLAVRIDVVNLTGSDKNSRGENHLERNLTMTNGYGYIAPLDQPGYERAGIKEEDNFIENGTDTQGRTVYSALWTLNRASNVRAGNPMVLQWSWEDGGSGSGRITNAIRFVPLGLAAPDWSDVTSEAPETCPDVYAYYINRVNTWYAQGEGCTPNINWRTATNITTTNINRTDRYTKTPIVCGDGIWSNVSGDFTPSHDGIW